MTIINSAQLRDNLADVLQTVATKQQSVLIGRFGQPKAVLIDYISYSWQKQILEYFKRIKKLTFSEIETLNILLDERAREAIFRGIRETQEGKLIPLEDLEK